MTQCGLWPIGIHRDYDDVQLYNYVNGPISLYSKNLMLKCSRCILNNEKKKTTGHNRKKTKKNNDHQI